MNRRHLLASAVALGLPTLLPSGAFAQPRFPMRAVGRGTMLERHGQPVRLGRQVLADANPRGIAEARALLRRRFGPEPARSLKHLLAAAPLDDIGLTRSRDTGRAIDL